MEQAFNVNRGEEFFVDHRFLASSWTSASPLLDNFAGLRATDHYPPDLEVEPTHISMRLRIDIDRETLQAKVIHTFIGRKDQAQTVRLHAEDFQNIEIATLGITHEYNGHELTLTWDKPFAREEIRQVEISYRVEKPITGLYFMRPSDLEPNNPYFAATDHETERARYWLPTIDLPNVRTTLEFYITAPEHLTILANGVCLSEKVNGDNTKTAHWHLKQKCPSYLICFAVGDFVRYDGEAYEGIPTAAFATKDFTNKDLERTFGTTAKMMAWMTKRLGVPFPYPKYFQFALPSFGGAMENISLVSWNDYCMCTEKTYEERSRFVDQINVHEMAHSYFGDLVVCRDFAHAWLKESWATYIESCWLEDQFGIDERQYNLFQNANAYFTEADQNYQRPLLTRRFTSSWQMYDRHLYPGGACRLHTLRQELGEHCFWGGVTDYLMTYAEGVVETDDFRKIMEKHSGRSLQKFFDQWIHSAGYPTIKVTFKFDAVKKIGTFVIEQKQSSPKDQSAAKISHPVFDLRTDIGWTINGTDFTFAIHLTEDKQSFTIPMESDPDQVRFDPHGKILHKLEFNPGEVRLKHQLTKAKDVVGRILAAKELSKSTRVSNVKAVLDAYNSEKFWGVRSQIVWALAKANSTEAISGILEIAKLEQHANVLGVTFSALAGIRDPRVVEVCRTRLDHNTLPPFAVEQALHAIGFQRNPEHIAYLTKFADTADPQSGRVQSAAFAAIAAIRATDSVPFLIAKTSARATRYRARPGALAALAKLHPYLDKGARAKIEDALIDHLRDHDPIVQHAAALGICEAKIEHALPLLEAHNSKLPLQEQVTLENKIKNLRNGDKPKIIALEKQVEELTDKMRKLQDKLEAISAETRVEKVN